jgi:YegS/Rv2252/BmrU family lipid kinase
MTRYKIILNPTSGRGTGAESLPFIEHKLTEYGLEFDITQTEHPWHAVGLAREAASAGYDYVVAAGGDGTANEVLNGLMQAKLAGTGSSAMGILCVGRGNDFAYGMRIPTDLAQGCRALLSPYLRKVDVGRVFGGQYPEGRFFGNGIGMGFDAVVGFEAVKMTWLSGFPSYIVAVLKTVFLYYKAPLVTIEFEDETIEQKALMVSVMNGQRMGGGFMMAPKGKPDDGQFHLCIAREVSRPRIFALVPHFMNGTQATQEPIRMARARKVVITALEGVLPAHADGETLCEDGDRLEAEILPRQIEIISQPPEE